MTSRAQAAAGAPARERPRWAAVVVIALASLLAACTGNDAAPTASARDPSTILVGSFDFPESRLLAALYADALEDRGYAVERAFGLGSREIVQPALQQGKVDLVPEYLGSALQFVTLGEADMATDPRALHRRLARALTPAGVRVLSFARAQDRNGIVVTETIAARYGLRKVSDLEPVAPQLTFGGPPECEERPLCLPGLRETYGLSFKAFRPLDTGGPQTVAALEGGDVDVALLFTTDPNIIARNLILLRDDRHLQPPENVVPVVSARVLAAHGREFIRVIDSVSGRLSTDELRSLNARVQLEGEGTARVASEWLERRGLAQ